MVHRVCREREHTVPRYTKWCTIFFFAVYFSPGDKNSHYPPTTLAKEKQEHLSMHKSTQKMRINIAVPTHNCCHLFLLWLQSLASSQQFYFRNSKSYILPCTSQFTRTSCQSWIVSSGGGESSLSGVSQLLGQHHEGLFANSMATSQTQWTGGKGWWWRGPLYTVLYILYKSHAGGRDDEELVRF